MAYIGREPTNSGQFLLIDDISSNFNGSNTSFNLTIGGNAINPAKENILVALDGVLQESDEAYAVTGSQITFTEAPGGTVSFYGVLTGESQFIANESISNDKISPTANISGSKINTDFSAQTVQAKIFSGMVSSSAQIASDISGSFSQAHLSSKISGIVSASSIASSAQGEVTLTTNGVAASAVDLGLQTSDSVQFSSVQADGGVTVDNITIDGTEIDLSSGNLTVDVAGNIVLDADGAQIRLEDNGTEFGRFSRVSSDLVIKSMGNDNDILFKGVDGSSTITALQLDMSEAGNAIFNNDVTIAGTLTAQEIHTEFTSASIMFSSGSTKFGDTIDDTHEVTGSMTMSGSVTVNDGNLIVTNNIGIGGTPSFKLDVQDTADPSQIRIKQSGNSNGLLIKNFNGNEAQIVNVDNGPLVFKTNDNEVVRFKSGGNVGIGTNNPDKTFHVEKSVGGDFVSRIRNSDGTNGEALNLKTNNTTTTSRLLHAENSGGRVFTIYNDAKVLIGNNDGFTASSASLHIAQNEPTIRLQDMNNASDTFVQLNANSSAGSLEIEADGANKKSDSVIDFRIDGDGIARLDNFGNLGIGPGKGFTGGVGFTSGTHNHRGGANSATLHISGSVPRILLEDSGDDPSYVIEAQDYFAILEAANDGTSETTRLRIKNDGNVGLGTNNPDDGQLHVYRSQSAFARILIENEGTSSTSQALLGAKSNAGTINFGITPTQHSFSGDAIIYNTANTGLQIATNNTTRMLITNAGLVGIGTTNPIGKLQIQDTTTGTVGETLTLDTNQTLGGRGTMIRFTGNNRGFVGAEIQGRIDQDGTEKMSLLFKTNNGSATNEIMRITADSKVGIGTIAPTNLLHVFQDASSYPVLFQQNQGDGFVLDLLASASDDAANDPLFRARTDAATLLELMNDGRMLLNAGHFICAGAVIPGSTSEVDNQKIFDSSSGTGSNTLFIGNAQIQVSSDKRLKINIRDTEMNPIETLNRLRVVDFDWDDPKDTSWNNKMARVKHGGQWSGILAQEAVEVVPHIINAPRIEETLELDHESENTWQVEYEHLVPTLVKAIQELSQKNEALEKRIEELEK